MSFFYTKGRHFAPLYDPNMWLERGLESIVQLGLFENYPFLIPDEYKSVFHYTPIESFEKIIESRNLHLTHILDLEDKTELKYGLDAVSDALRSMIGESDHISECVKSLDDLIDVKPEALSTKSIYVVCFSLKSDRNALWSTRVCT